MGYGLGFAGSSDLGQTDLWVTSPDGTVMQNTETGAVIVLPDASSPTSYPTPVQPAMSGGDWWSGLQTVLTPLASIAGSIVKAISGTTQQPLPSGYTRNPITGQIVPTAYAAPSTTMSWLLPVGLLGIGAVLLMRKR